MVRDEDSGRDSCRRGSSILDQGVCSAPNLVIGVPVKRIFLSLKNIFAPGIDLGCIRRSVQCHSEASPYKSYSFHQQLGQWEDAKVSLDKARQLLSVQVTSVDKSLHQSVEAATRDLALKCSGPSTDDTSGEQLVWYKALMILPLVECSQRRDTSVRCRSLATGAADDNLCLC